MADLKIQVKHALDEARILVVGTSVLLGFHYRAPLEAGFDRLPTILQLMKLGALGLLLVTTMLLLTPPAVHQIVEGGADTRRLHGVTTLACALALLPFAMTLAIDFFFAGELVLGPAGAIGLALGALGLALGAWYGVGLWARRRWRRRGGIATSLRSTEVARTTLTDRIEHVLTEARVVLPGAQALLGFQFAGILGETFERLPASSRLLHLGSLGFIALAMMMLMTPAAWHRMVEDGEDTERFHRIASVLVLSAMATLALGLAVELVVVVRKVTGDLRLGVAAALVALVMFYGVWFGLTAWARARLSRPRASSAQRAA